MSVAIAILIVCVAIVWVVQRSQRRRPNRFEAERPSTPNQVSGRTRKRLMTLLNGDRAGAARLLEGARLRNPGRSEQWYWEKVIFDIERDRHIH